MANVHCVPRVVSSIRRAETDVVKTAGRGKIMRKFSTGPRMSLLGRATRSGHGVLSDFHAETMDFNGIFDEIKNQLSQCKLSEAHEKLKEILYDDLKGIRDLIFKGLIAHRQVAHVIQDVLNTAPQHGHVPDVCSRVDPAWKAIDALNSQLRYVVNRLGQRSEELKFRTPPGDPAFEALCKLLENMKCPAVPYCAPRIWSGIRMDPEELKTLSADVIQCLSDVGAAARFKVFVDGAAFNTPFYNHDTFKATGNSLVSMMELTKQLGKIMSSLEHSWQRTHSGDYIVTAQTPSTNELLGIAEILDKHVKDCMVMASNTQRKFTLQKELLSPVELYEERKWQSYGAQALRSCPKRAATLVTYVEKRISKVHRVVRSRYMTLS